ncbi:MAG: hypothetical protein C0453_09330 [Comamonadaceae bacterium]|nr:hypothetical protein [Comamonadaceae bacterium]
MTNASLMPSSNKSAIPWWKIPQVLLIPGLLLTGVLATSTMVVLAVNGQDPVLDKEVYERERRAALAFEGQARIDALMAVQPAHQGRNHAASPVVPSAE